MRPVTLATLFVLLLPLHASAQKYACGESCQNKCRSVSCQGSTCNGSDCMSGNCAAKKSRGVMGKLRDSLAIPSLRKPPVQGSEIGLVSYDEEISDARLIQPRTKQPSRLKSRLAAGPIQRADIEMDSSDNRRVDNRPVSAIPATPESEESAEVMQVRFVDREHSRPDAGSEEQWTRAKNENGSSLEGLRDPASRFAPHLMNQQSRTLNTIRFSEETTQRSRNNGQMTPEELANFVRRQRKQGGFRWPWSR